MSKDSAVQRRFHRAQALVEKGMSVQAACVKVSMSAATYRKRKNSENASTPRKGKYKAIMGA